MKEVSNPCRGNESINQGTLEAHYDGFGCTKEDALNAAWDKIIAALEGKRTHKCDGDCPEGEECSLLINEDESDVVDPPVYRRVRMSVCSKRVGYRCRLAIKQLNAIETTCVCVPGVV